MHPEMLSFNWYNQAAHLKKILQELRSDDSFSDVTLVTDDKKSIRAHKNILSACSPVFQAILKLDSQAIHPIIYLRGINHFEMNSILEFIYFGQVTMSKEKVNEVLAVAKSLDIRDLSLTQDDEKVLDVVTNNDTVDDINDEDNVQSLNEFQRNDCIKPKDINTKVLDDITLVGNAVDTDDEDEVESFEFQGNNSINPKDEISNKNLEDLAPNKDSKHIISEECEDVIFHCNDCGKQFNTQRQFSIHKESVHLGIRFKCNLCDKQYCDESGLRRHRKSIHEGLRYKCDHCEGEFTNPRSLRRHIESLRGRKIHEHKKIENLKYIENEVDMIEREDFLNDGTADDEDDSIKSKDELTHKIFQCNECEKKFGSKANLFSHKEIVHSGFQYKCNMCDKLYSDESGLRRHRQSIHEGLRYKCDLCERQVTSPHALRIHVESAHEGNVGNINHIPFMFKNEEGLFECNECDKQFNLKNSFFRHQQTVHSGVQFKCNQCDKQYRDKKSLRSHRKIHHEGIRYKCNQCDNQYTYPHVLRAHIQSAHGDVKITNNDNQLED